MRDQFKLRTMCLKAVLVWAFLVSYSLVHASDGDHSFPFKDHPLGDHSFPLLRTAYLSAVIDGDSVIVELADASHEYRWVDLAGVDAMELSYKGVHHGFGAEVARDELRAFIPEKIPLFLAFEDQQDGSLRDPISPMKAYVYKWNSKSQNWQSVNRWLLKEGWAVCYIEFPRLKKAHEYLSLTKEAKAAGRGIFSQRLWRGIPYDFRVLVDQNPIYWIADFFDKSVSPPESYYFVPLDHRIYFPTLESALQSGYHVSRRRAFESESP